MTTLLVDADITLWRASSACQREYRWSPSSVSISADFPEARRIVERQLKDFRRALNADDMILCLSDPDTANNFRKQILPSYKAERVKRAKPVLFRQLREWLESAYTCRWEAGLEGDDLLGIGATGPRSKAENRIVVTIDKDLQGVPCRLWNPSHPEDGVREIAPEAAARFHLLQTLMGDSVDGYFGIPGIGAKKAAAILDRPAPAGAEELPHWTKIINAYARAGKTEADALTQARVARILQHGDWNKEIGVRLWLPTSST